MNNLLLVERYEVKTTMGVWLATVPRLPGCRAHGATESEAIRKVLLNAYRFIAGKLERGTLTPEEALEVHFQLATPEQQPGPAHVIPWEETLGWKAEAATDGARKEASAET